MARRPNEQTMTEYKEAFSLFDRKGERKVGLEELGNLVRSVGLSPSEAEVAQLKNEIEKQGKRGLEFNDFVDLMSRHQNMRESSDEVREAFRTFDKDGNGYLSASELRHVLTCLGEKLTDEEVDELIREAEITGDGMVSYEHFVKVLQE